MKKALVTGGAGFIGSHIVDRLIADGVTVAIVDNLNTGRLENLNPHAVFHHIDIRDDALGKIISDFQPDYIFHLAAQANVSLSAKKPIDDIEINTIGTVNLLEHAVANNVEHFIFSSTGGAIYGETDNIPTPESEQPILSNPYAINKYSAERFIEFYRKHHDLKSTILRYANVFGPRQTGAYESGVVSIIIQKIVAGETFKMYAFPDQRRGMTRDYVYVSDVVDANMLAIDCDGGLFNIGKGIETPTLEIFDELCKIAGKDVEHFTDNARPGEIRKSALDASRAKKILGWTPKISLIDGLSRTFESFETIAQGQ
jgi:UDP-glucose 4-epimerase